MGGVVQAILVSAASSTSDNAARATSDERQKLSVEVVKAKAVIDSHLVARPEALFYAAETLTRALWPCLQFSSQLDYRAQVAGKWLAMLSQEQFSYTPPHSSHFHL